VLASADYISLPGNSTFTNTPSWSGSCLSLDSERLRGRLLDAIRGRGAFRRFKDLAQACGILDDWYRFRDDALKKIAAEFLEVNGIAYVDEKVR